MLFKIKNFSREIILIIIFLATNANIKADQMDKNEQIVLGGGCFWCIEAVFEMTRGVDSAISGYAGGHTSDPSYQDVCTGNSGHAEVVKVSYNPEIIALSEILDIFFTIHDPTQKNRQGADVGTQYRSAIYFMTTQQKSIIENYIQNLKDRNAFDGTLHTEVKPLNIFYPAEINHQEYYAKNEFAPYCSMVIKPKVRKFKSKFPDAIKTSK